MSHRNDFHCERLVEHLQEREWSQSDIDHFTHMIGHSALLSSESAMFVLEFQQATDERIQAEKDFDEVFVPGAQQGYGVDPFVPRIPQDFFEQRFEGIE